MRNDERLLQEAETKRANVKARRWERLQKEAPDTAEVVLMVSKIFGKPKKLAIKFDGENYEIWR